MSVEQEPEDDGDYSPEAIARHHAKSEPLLNELFSAPVRGNGLTGDTMIVSSVAGAAPAVRAKNP